LAFILSRDTLPSLRSGPDQPSTPTLE
jgi:hypothetical protein